MEHPVAQGGGVPLLKAGQRLCFDALQNMGRLGLWAEATATRACYQSLFSDEEIDFSRTML